MLAILKAGGAYVPIDPAYPADRIAWPAGALAGQVRPAQPPGEPRLPRSSRWRSPFRTWTPRPSGCLASGSPRFVPRWSGPGGGSLRAVLVYNPLLWKAETAQRLVDDYVGILRVMAATPDALAS